jgi:peptidoglycan hydrolase-like protein with peptidoglycan-binding domain
MRIGLLIGGAIGALAAAFAAMTGTAKAAPAPKLGGSPVPPPSGEKPGGGTAALPPGSLPGSAAAGQAAAERPLLSQARSSRGPDVAEWQKVIGVVPDGIFGASTDRVTRAWQKANGLIVDGIVGPKCWAAAHASGIAPAGGVNSGAVSVSASGAVDDGFDALLAAALAKNDIPALIKLAEQADARGLYESARSIWQEIALRTSKPPAPIKPVVDQPQTAPTDKPTGRAILSYAAGSRGADVIEWQRIIGVKQDGIFGAGTESKTKTWQKARGLNPDGIVGPKSWELAYRQEPALAVTPRPPVVVTPTAVVVTSPGIMPGNAPRMASAGESYVVTYSLPRELSPVESEALAAAAQSMMSGVAETLDGRAEGKTARAVFRFKVAAPLPAIGSCITTPIGPVCVASVAPYTGGTVIPASYNPAVNPATVVPASDMLPESDGRTAAIELTDYLTKNGGLAFRWKEDFKRMSAWMTRLGVPDPKGKYGRDTARAIMQRGIVPVTPYYWPATGAPAAKREFLALVKTYADSDPQRAAQWAKLASDVNRA